MDSELAQNYFDTFCLTVQVHALEEYPGQHLHPAGEVAESGGAVAEAAPRVQPLGQGDGGHLNEMREKKHSSLATL